MKKLFAVLLITALAVGVFGCVDQKAAKVKEFNDYFKQEEKITDKFTNDFKLVENKMASAQNMEDLSKSFKEGTELLTKATNQIKALKVPAELKAYQDQELADLNELITSFDKLNQALAAQDLTKIEAEAKKIEEIGAKMKDGNEFDNLLKEAAKKEGIQVEIKDDTVLFKK